MGCYTKRTHYTLLLPASGVFTGTNYNKHQNSFIDFLEPWEGGRAKNYAPPIHPPSDMGGEGWKWIWSENKSEFRRDLVSRQEKTWPTS